MQEQSDSSCDWRIKQLIDDLQWLENDDMLTEPDMLAHINELKQYLLDSINNQKRHPVHSGTRLLDKLNELQKRIDALESMPAVSKGKLRVVNKSDDYIAKKESYSEFLSNHSVHELMKTALNKPLILSQY